MHFESFNKFTVGNGTETALRKSGYTGKCTVGKILRESEKSKE